MKSFGNLSQFSSQNSALSVRTMATHCMFGYDPKTSFNQHAQHKHYR